MSGEQYVIMRSVITRLIPSVDNLATPMQMATLLFSPGTSAIRQIKCVPGAHLDEDT